ADNFRGRAAAGDEQCLSDCIFVRKNFFCSGLADETNIPAFGKIMFIEITPRDERNSQALEISRHNVVAWGARAVFDWRHIAVRTGVKRAIPAGERNIAADSRALDAWRIAQRSENLLGKTLARRPVGIVRGRHVDRSNPEVVRLKPKVLSAQPNEAGNE